MDSKLLALLLGAVAAVLGLIWRSRSSKPAPSAPVRVTEKEKERPPGVWPPVDYSYPPISAVPASFDLSTVDPIPYRPFRHNSYPINMGIRPLPVDNWIQLDSQSLEYLKIRAQRTLDRGKLVTDTQPGFHPHALECLNELCSFLAARYPSLYKVTRCSVDAEKEATWGDSIAGKEAGAVVGIENSATGERFNWKEERDREGDEWNPMRVAGLLVPDDLALMLEDENGEYVLRAGSIATAGGWRLEDKIGRTLHLIHTQGHDVPGWRDKLKPSMERFFVRMKADKPVERNNYFFQTCPSLPWALDQGPEEAFDMNTRVANPDLLPTSSDPSWKPHGPAKEVDELHFRTERQSLRRLPRRGAILFTIKTQMLPVVEMAKEPGVPGRLASAIRTWPKDVIRYKGGSRWIDILLPYLDREHAEQLASGVIELDEDGAVVGANKYPY
ncbi:hypothetical protein BCR35DRAFT_301583 [Leucosporidium creatinivorum]|uniref:Uncharacterized protein n=1 Tax=Leucosporidium creatinivorum TaxID=106004 RepID=A0A1Y2FWP3_9BASI|nr:hypothetical protein BCR35DRAFT_301583 [Leucosporidium creatinivorum]